MFGPAIRDEEIVHLALAPKVGGSFSFLVTRNGEDIEHVGKYLEIVRPSRLVSLEADVFVPAASGGLVDEAFSRRCSARIVCGPANNQLAFRGAEEILARRGIVYVPDVLVGAGALIAGALRHLKGVTDPGRAIDRIGGRVADLLRESRRRGGLATETARSLAERRLARGR